MKMQGQTKPQKYLIVSSDEEEDSSDGDDSIHTSDIDFVEDDSEPNPDEDYSYDTTSSSEFASDDNEGVTESGSESNSSGGIASVGDGQSASAAPGSNDTDEQIHLAAAIESFSISAALSAEDRDVQVLKWLNKQIPAEEN
jgi:hypothetical protein